MGKFANYQGLQAHGEPHIACVLLLDTSSSMEDAKSLLEKAVMQFKEEVSQDELSKKRVDVAIVSFDSDVKVIQDFVPIQELQSVHLKCSGITQMADGINKAIDLVRQRRNLYGNLGIPSYAPWIFMLTDGASTQNLDEVSKRIYLEENNVRRDGTIKRKLKFWSCGIPGYNPTDLATLGERIIELDGYSFKGIFNWLANSMVIISNSEVDEKVKLRDLPEDAHIVLRREIPGSWND